ncbi:MAG TPA: metallophosphoesterase [Cyclobacteriaceae bacterium]|nr:metallophosphoesterase [Cyclobacteriaceae bacterium]
MNLITFTIDKPSTLLRYILLLFVLTSTPVIAQKQIAFVSDTQAPMWAETIVLKPNQNERATGLIFHDILQQKPTSVFILGDVVNLGFKESRWVKMDRYVDSCRKVGIHVSALLGNHDVMRNAKKGEQVFKARFPTMVRTGSYEVVDSVAVVFLNSNFSKLSTQDNEVQLGWLHTTLQNLDRDPSVMAIIITCHHAPFSNSKIVGSSDEVQRKFVAEYKKSVKAILFMTGHSHNYEHFINDGKDFLVIGGGGGLHQPLTTQLKDVSGIYKPEFHYLMVQRNGHKLTATSRFLHKDFTGFENGLSFTLAIP